MRPVGSAAFLVAVTMLPPLAGCALGPAAIQSGRVPYNEVLQRTNAQQLLLNLVRLLYRENPLFLDVGSISAQYVVTQAGQVNGTLTENVPHMPINPDVLTLDGRLALEERPTITYTPLQGGEFASRMLSPLTLDTIELLLRSGWRVDRVLRLTMQGANGLDNASAASGPTPAEPPRFEQFARVCTLLRDLQMENLLFIGYEPRPVRIGPPIPASSLSAANVLQAAQQGVSIQAVDGNSQLVTLSRTEKTLLWRIPAAARDHAAVRELVELLRLRPGPAQYAIEMNAGGPLVEPDAAGRFDRITFVPRSLLGSLFYLSQGVQVPPPDAWAGKATVTRTPDGEPFDWGQVVGDLLTVRSAALPPADPVVSVRYRNWWFYIRDTDESSKSTFALLGQLFALQAGAASGASPVLTLGLGG